MIREHDMVALTRDVPEIGLKAGAMGAVVHIYPRAVAYEVEFNNPPAGNAFVTQTVEAADVRPLTKRELARVRVDA